MLLPAVSLPCWMLDGLIQYSSAQLQSYCCYSSLDRPFQSTCSSSLSMEATPAGVAALRAGRLSPRVMRWSSREAEATLLSSHLTSQPKREMVFIWRNNTESRAQRQSTFVSPAYYYKHPIIQKRAFFYNQDNIIPPPLTSRSSYSLGTALLSTAKAMCRPSSFVDELSLPQAI
jgi:hypothetical protein